MKKVVSIIFLIAGIISLGIGIGIMYKNESGKQKALEALKTSIVNDYEDFKVKVEVFSEERTNIYQSLNKITYLTDIKVNYASLIEEYKKYEETLKEIDKVSKDLKVNCFEQEFKEVTINNKISAFVINYEQAVNYFIQDVNNFNEKVKLYNDWLKQTYPTAQVVELEEYVSSYTKYVDVNNDGVFEGVKEK
ncbi:MAG: hypothetical protein E7162_07310 [Firmicutes bacterium]|nr:hypothetical protein [Bacillota bacterium]